MKYMLLIYENPRTREAFFADDTLMADMDAWVKGLEESGEWVGGEGLAYPDTARTVRFTDAPAVTDGPFLEAKEFFGGYSIVDCDSIERATEIASRFPGAPAGGAVEVRPMMSGNGGSEV